MGAHDPGRSSSDVGDAARLRSRAQLEEVGDALYKDAHNRRLRRQMLQEQLNAELEEVRRRPPADPALAAPCPRAPRRLATP
jgi:hypothetical protein